MTPNTLAVLHVLIVAGACAAWIGAILLGFVTIARRVKFQQKYSPIPAITYAAIGVILTTGAFTL